MTTRVVSKNLICEEDLALGVGTVAQTRAGNSYTLNKITSIKPVSSVAELVDVDTSKYRYAIIFGAADSQIYWYDSGSLTWETYDPTAGAGTGTDAFAYIDALRLSEYAGDYVSISGYAVGNHRGYLRLYKAGTGTPTASAAAIPNALAAGTFCNAASVQYRLSLDNIITPYLFGFAEGANETTAIAATIAFTSANNCRLYWPKAQYNTAPIAVPSNSYWVFHPQAELYATTGYGVSDCLLSFSGASNITIECNSAVFKMRKADYTSGETRHVFNLVNCSNITLINPNGQDSGGDIYYIKNATDLTLVNPKGLNARRNGCSLVSATRLKCTGIASFGYSTGATLSRGLHIVPDGTSDLLVDINFDTIEIYNNAQIGFHIDLTNYGTTTVQVRTTISIARLRTKNNGTYGSVIRYVRNIGKGLISIGELHSYAESYSALYFSDKDYSGADVYIGYVNLANSCQAGSSGASLDSALYFFGSCGGINMPSIDIYDSTSKVQVGIDGTDELPRTSLGINSIVGTYPSFAHISFSTASSPNKSFVISGPKQFSVNTVTDLNLVQSHALSELTSTGTLTIRLLDKPVGSLEYCIRNISGTLSIVPFITSDRIVGTTGPSGGTVSTSVVGASCRVRSLGSNGGNYYWLVIPEGRAADWTFT